MEHITVRRSAASLAAGDRILVHHEPRKPVVGNVKGVQRDHDTVVIYFTRGQPMHLTRTLRVDAVVDTIA